jgi:SAM-dependent methyltransferase
VTAVDASGEMLRHARRHEAAAPAGITFVQDTAEELGTLAGRTFDAVVCHMALMDIHDLASALESVARVLRDDGRFVFSIVHPCYHGHVQVVADYSTDHRYAKRVRREWLPPHAYHRPISTYVNELACRGLHLERVVEVHHSRADADEGAVPGLFYARARKARRDPIAADSR